MSPKQDTALRLFMAGQWIFDGRCVIVFWTLARGRIVCVLENAMLGSARLWKWDGDGSDEI